MRDGTLHRLTFSELNFETWIKFRNEFCQVNSNGVKLPVIRKIGKLFRNVSVATANANATRAGCLNGKTITKKTHTHTHHTPNAVSSFCPFTWDIAPMRTLMYGLYKVLDHLIVVFR